MIAQGVSLHDVFNAMQNGYTSEAEQQRWEDLGESIMAEVETSTDGEMAGANRAPA